MKHILILLLVLAGLSGYCYAPAGPEGTTVSIESPEGIAISISCHKAQIRSLESIFKRYPDLAEQYGFLLTAIDAPHVRWSKTLELLKTNPRESRLYSAEQVKLGLQCGLCVNKSIIRDIKAGRPTAPSMTIAKCEANIKVCEEGITRWDEIIEKERETIARMRPVTKK